ncbi:hypothetical protein ACFFX1_11125 [Dactylosporangium sucinum]|uniref:Uncharacterized protein n=1 Tax=Dactylosporangium sucinum TaxID=1424081 RepID=A0A917TH46_9ACTN|nr:hypothetical protein [Dactylosporangium sucinum]GGM22451.1 hypothetical protein GCM10007977_024510 [Dactylosporangium sucinum]
MSHHHHAFGVTALPDRCWITLPVHVALADLAAFVQDEHDGAHYRDQAEAIAGGGQEWADAPEAGPYTVAQLPEVCVQLRCTACGYLFDEDGDTGYHLPDEADARSTARAAGWTSTLVCTGCQVARLIDGARVTVTGTVVDCLIVDLGAGAQAWALLDGPALLKVTLAPATLAACAAPLRLHARIAVTGTVREHLTGRRSLTADHVAVHEPAW